MRGLLFGDRCWRALRTAGARLCRDDSGAVLMEYAFVGPPFIALVMGVLYTALVYLGQEGLETAAETGGRMLLTGEAQTMGLGTANSPYTGMTASDFKNAICYGLSGTDVSGNAVSYPGALPPFMTCSRLTVNVAIYPSGVTPTTNVSYTNGSPTGGFGTESYNAATNTYTNSNAGLSGSQNELVVLQLYYEWPTASDPLAGLNLVNQSGGNRLLVATSVFTVEGYTCPSGQKTC